MQAIIFFLILIHHLICPLYCFAYIISALAKNTAYSKANIKRAARHNFKLRNTRIHLFPRDIFTENNKFISAYTVDPIFAKNNLKK